MKRWRRGVACALWYIGAEPPLTRLVEAPLPRSSPRYPASASGETTSRWFVPWRTICCSSSKTGFANL